MRSTRTTMRSERSRSSRTSTKPAMSTFHNAADSTGWAIIDALRGGGRQPCCQGGGTHRQGKRERSVPRQDGRRRRRSEQETRRPWRRLSVDGEIDRDAAAECDGEPGYEPPRADLDRRSTRGRALPTRRAKSERPSGHASAGRRPAATRGAIQGRQASVLPRALSCSTIARPPDARDTTSVMLQERCARRIRFGPCIHSAVARGEPLTGAPAGVRGATAGATQAQEAGYHSPRASLRRRRIGSNHPSRPAPLPRCRAGPPCG